MRKVYSFNSELFKVTGVQKVLMDVHHAIMGEYDAKIVGTVSYDKLHKDLDIQQDEYVKIKNPFMFRNSIVILHERKFLAFFWLLNRVFFRISNWYIYTIMCLVTIVECLSCLRQWWLYLMKV